MARELSAAGPCDWPRHCSRAADVNGLRRLPRSQMVLLEKFFSPAVSSTAIQRIAEKMFQSTKKIVSSPRCFVWFKKKEKSSLKILQPGRRNPWFCECLVTASFWGMESMYISPKWPRHFNETRKIWELNSIPLLWGFNAKTLRKFEIFFFRKWEYKMLFPTYLAGNKSTFPPTYIF